jgi:hypothetical protein
MIERTVEMMLMLHVHLIGLYTSTIDWEYKPIELTFEIRQPPKLGLNS